jgi:hypothetical protein
VREKSNFVNRFKLIRVVSSLRAKISLSENQNLCILPAVPLPQEGRFAVVTDVGSGMRWPLWLCVDERSLKRTAKSCGSGAPKQALRSQRCSRILRVTVATKRWSPRRARITRKTIAQGMPVDPALPVVTAACFFVAGGPWVRSSPGIPCALCSHRGQVHASLGRIRAAGTRICILLAV